MAEFSYIDELFLVLTIPNSVDTIICSCKIVTYILSETKGAGDQDCVGASKAQLHDVCAVLSIFIPNSKVGSGKGTSNQ